MDIESWGRGLRRPPLMVVNAAQRAFRERPASESGRAELVFDSTRDDVEREGARVLMFTSEDFDLVLTVAPSSRGALVGGAAMSRVPIVVGIRRPLRATIVLRSDDNGVLVDTAVPSGASCVVVYTQDGEKGEKWESEWLTL
jgi:hypothetical protein